MIKRPSRRAFLRQIIGVGIGFGLYLPRAARMQEETPEGTPEFATPPAVELSGTLTPVHDPVIIKADGLYYLFCTGNEIPIRKSENLSKWKQGFPPKVFGRLPEWAADMIPRATNIWAPDIAYYNGKYLLYYSVSTFGSNRSAIGLATNVTFDSKDDAYEWVDEGLVIASERSFNYNCIDPNFVVDADGNPWLSFGSFWTGIKMRRLDAETGKLSTEDETLYSLAQRHVNDGSIEAAFIIRKGNFYYLFVSFDFCCQGVDSTYHVRVGRSESIVGPYVDRDGVEMLNGGGTQVTFPTERWKGLGHNSILQTDAGEYLVYHSYDAENQGVPTLRIDPLTWDEEGWPSISVSE